MLAQIVRNLFSTSQNHTDKPIDGFETIKNNNSFIEAARKEIDEKEEIKDNKFAQNILETIVEKNIYKTEYHECLFEIYDIIEKYGVAGEKLLRLSGEIHLFRCEFEQAEKQLLASTSPDGKQYWSYRLLSVVYERMGNYKASIKFATMAEPGFPGDVSFYKHCAKIETHLPRSEKPNLNLNYIKNNTNNIIMLHEHIDQYFYWSKMAIDLNMNVYLLEDRAQNVITSKIFSYSDKIHIIDLTDLKSLSGNNFVLVPSLEKEDFLYEKVGPRLSNPIYFHVMANNINETGKGKRANRVPKNLVACDIQSADYWIRHGVRNVIYLYPFAAGDLYPYSPVKHDTKPIINCYIQNYNDVHAVNTKYTRVFHEIISDYFKNRVEFNLYGYNNPNGILKPNEWKAFPDGDKLEKNYAGWQYDAIKNSIFTIHIKRWEGYGYNVMKSLSAGRPVIGMRHLVSDKTISNFCLDGFTSLLGEQDYMDELIFKIAYFMDNKEIYNEMSQNCTDHIKNLCDPNRDKFKLANFFMSCIAS